MSFQPGQTLQPKEVKIISEAGNLFQVVIYEKGEFKVPTSLEEIELQVLQIKTKEQQKIISAQAEIDQADSLLTQAKKLTAK